MDTPTVALSAPIAQYLLAVSLDNNMRSERMDALAQATLADLLFPGNGNYIEAGDAPLLAREAFSATIWR